QHDGGLNVDPLERRLHPRRLGRDEQRVDRLLQARDRPGVRGEAAELDAVDLDAVGRDLGRGLLARDDNHLVARPIERAREQAPDAARAEHRDLQGRASSRTPGFITPAGSSACLAPRSAAAKGSGRWRSYQGRWSRPTAWWW